jgi:hypothetical protein
MHGHGGDNVNASAAQSLAALLPQKCGQGHGERFGMRVLHFQHDPPQRSLVTSQRKHLVEPQAARSTQGAIIAVAIGFGRPGGAMTAPWQRVGHQSLSANGAEHAAAARSQQLVVAHQATRWKYQVGDRSGGRIQETRANMEHRTSNI